MALATMLSTVFIVDLGARAQEARGEPEPVGDPSPAELPSPISDDALWLARVCVHEAGFRSPDDCRAIWRVFERGGRRHHTTPIGFARMYSRTVFDSARTDARGWITRLVPTGDEPAGFPTTVERRVDGRLMRHRHPPWSSFRDDWLRILAVSQRVVSGELRARCRAPDDWGGAMDAPRAARLGLLPLSCGDTHNVFYARPSSRRRAAASPPASR